MTDDSRSPGLDQAELDAERGEALPDREALSIVSIDDPHVYDLPPSPVDDEPAPDVQPHPRMPEAS